MRKSALLARRATPATAPAPTQPAPGAPLAAAAATSCQATTAPPAAAAAAAARRAHETIYCNPRKKKDGSRDGFLVLSPGKKIVLHDENGGTVFTKPWRPGDNALKEGGSLQMGNWLCEIGSTIPVDRFDSGAAIVNVPVAAPPPAARVQKTVPTAAPRRPLHPMHNAAALSSSAASSSSSSSSNAPALARVVGGNGVGGSRFGPVKPRFQLPAIVEGPTEDLILNRGDANAVAVKVDRQLAVLLRPHQVEGVQYMYDRLMGRAKASKEDDSAEETPALLPPTGCILAHEMGLGKSLQALALLYTLLRSGPRVSANSGAPVPAVKKAVIVCPASLCNNWKAECAKWLGQARLVPVLLDGAAHEAARQVRDFCACPPQRLLILSYEAMQKHAQQLADAGGSVGLVICDEGHRLKSAAGNKTTEALRKLGTARRVILTGTPLQNNLEEMWAMCDFVAPGVLGPLPRFRAVFAQPIDAGRQTSADAEARRLSEARSLQLKGLTAQIILRRDRTVLARFLPPRHEMVVCCRLSDAQTAAYKQLLAEYSAGSEALSIVTRLRGLCSCSCADPVEDQDSGGAGSGGGAAAAPRAVQQQADADEQTNAKIKVLMGLLRHAREAGDKVVIAAQFQNSLDLLQAAFAARGWGCLRLDGRVPTKERQGLVDRFNRADSDAFGFLLSTRAGGTGFNLVAANRMVLFDMDWNPASDEQAMARVYREGQKREVRIWRLVTTGGVEEKVLQRQLFKRDMAQQLMGADGRSDHQFATDDLRRLFALDERTRCATLDLLLRAAGRAADAPQLTATDEWLPLLPDAALQDALRNDAALLAAVTYACDVNVLHSLHGVEPPDADADSGAARQGQPRVKRKRGGGGGGRGGGGGAEDEWVESDRSEDEEDDGEMDDFVVDDDDDDDDDDEVVDDEDEEEGGEEEAAGRAGTSAGTTADDLELSDEDERLDETAAREGASKRRRRAILDSDGED